jgi:hypothetical protein
MRFRYSLAIRSRAAFGNLAAPAAAIFGFSSLPPLGREMLPCDVTSALTGAPMSWKSVENLCPRGRILVSQQRQPSQTRNSRASPILSLQGRSRVFHYRWVRTLGRHRNRNFLNDYRSGGRSMGASQTAWFDLKRNHAL